MKLDGFKIVGLVAVVLGCVSSLLSDYSHNQEMKDTVREEVARQLGEKEEES